VYLITCLVLPCILVGLLPVHLFFTLFRIQTVENNDVIASGFVGFLILFLTLTYMIRM
jgi:hypothetical protein